MKLRYTIEYALRDRIREPRYDPIGVWVQGPASGLDLVIEFLPGHAEAQENAEWVVNRLVENDVRSLPEGFLNYQATLSPYRGMRGAPVEKDDFPSAEVCAQSVLEGIVTGRIA